MAEPITQKYKRAFFAGLAAVLPTILTIGVLVFCWNALEQNVAQPINTGLRALLKTEVAQEWYWQKLLHVQPLEFAEDAEEAQRIADLTNDDVPAGVVPFSQRVEAHVPFWLGLVLALMAVLIVGFIFKGYIGKQVLRLVERLVLRVPLIRVIYPYAKQLTEFFFEGRRPVQYDSAVAIEYPRKGLYAIAFVTNEGFEDVARISGKEMVSVFVPSSPTPVTGYTIVLPKEDVIPLNMSVDEAIRFTISAGVLLPASQVPPLALKTRKLDTPKS